MAMKKPTERLIWAYSKVRPDQPHYSELTQHFSAGFLTLTLNKDLNNPSSFSHSHPDDESDSRPVIDNSDEPHAPFEKHERIIIAHGVIASIGFLVLLPAGSLIARWGRTMTPKWFKIHQTINMSIAVPVITLGWILGPIAVFDHQATHLFDAHQVCIPM